MEYSKAVVIIRPPMAAESAEEGELNTANVSKRAIINADRHSILTYLNIEVLMNSIPKYKRRNLFRICEIVHDFNSVSCFAFYYFLFLPFLPLFWS